MWSLQFEICAEPACDTLNVNTAYCVSWENTSQATRLLSLGHFCSGIESS